MTRETLLLTLDLGTTNCKAVVFDVHGREIARRQASYPTRSRGDAAFEQCPADWLEAADTVLSGIGAALGADAARLAGIALSAWGPGLVFVSDDGALLNDSPTWQDGRADPYGRRLIDEVGADWIGGGIPTTGFPAKLAWAHDAHPEAARRAVYALGVKDVVLRWLTGSIATETSSGPYAERWPRSVIEAAGWDLDRLPPVLAPTDVGGRLLPGRAQQLRLPEGLPVVMGLNDGASATLGVGCHHPGDAVVSLSTNGVLRVVTDRRPDTDACVASSFFRYPFVDSLWVMGGFALSGADSLRWLVESTTAESYEQLLEEATTSPPGADGVVFLPFLAGRGTPKPSPNASGALVGLRRHHGRAHLTRAVLEGVAFALRDISDALAAHNLRIERLRITGGGARSPLWREIIATALDVDVAYVEGDSNLGAAILLAVTTGAYPSFEDAVARMTRPSLTRRRVDQREAYAAAFSAYSSTRAALYG